MSKAAFQIDNSQRLPEKVLLVGVDFSAGKKSADFQAALDEARELVSAAGGIVTAVESCTRDKPHSALFVGTGKAEELAAKAAVHEIDLAVFNHELTPTQERNLEKVLQCRVLDRIGLILAIFARRAQTHEGRLQVELAQLTHLAGRLVRGYGHLQSQRGGIGLRGPGETQLETDRRLITVKIARLRQKLKAVKKQRAVQRKNRERRKMPVFALVGYTNVGKSTLFNRLAKAEVYVQDQLFATLDTTARRLWLAPEISVILTDTVGFVRALPHGLIAAFSATLEETLQADVLFHVVDAAHDDVDGQIAQVGAVLEEIGALGIARVLVYNKSDKLPEHLRPDNFIVRDAAGKISAVHISAHTGEGLPQLRAAMTEIAQEILQRDGTPAPDAQ